MLFFAIQLDEEQIKKDGVINLDGAYRSIDKTFAQKEVTLYEIKDGIRYYTRDIDKNDFAYLWMVNLVLDKVDWFKKYVKVWRFINIDDDTNEVVEEEDLLEDE